MGAISGPAIYGATRGIMDARKEGMEEDAFNTDQAIRKERLSQEQQERPLRRKALELGVQDAEHAIARRPKVEAMQDALGQLNIDATKLSVDEKTKAAKEADETLARQKKLRTGLAQFTASADPKYVADALGEVYPEHMKGVQATRGENGEITLAMPGSDRPMIFKGKKWEDGSQMNADDELAMFAYNVLDPVKAFEKKWEHARKVGIEGEKTQRAVSVAGMRAEGASERASARRSDAWYNRQHSAIKPSLDAILKTTGTAGSFIAGYAHENDAALRGLIEQRVESEIEDNGTPVRQAANKVVDDVRAGYDLLDKKAREHAGALAKAKIKPTDRKAVEAAAQAGNEDAKNLLKTLGTAQKHLGPSVAKYLESQLPAK